MIDQRVQKLRRFLQSENIDAALIVQPENRYYFSGFTGTSGFLFITPSSKYLLTDFRYAEQAVKQSPGSTIITYDKDVKDDLKVLLDRLDGKRIGIEENYLTYRQYKEFQESFKREFLGISEQVNRIRSVKDASEIQCLKKAAFLVDQAFEYIITQIKPGISEQEISLELEFFMRRKGASGASFDFIVASGERSSLPHGVAGKKIIHNGDFITMDFGCIWQGYHSDTTRTVVMGKIDSKQADIYQIVYQAQTTALKEVRPGISCHNLDRIAREIIEKNGYGSYFGHSLGHGVGLEIHETPRVGPDSSIVLEPGMVITIEPGIYIPNWGGVRIEDMVLVTSDGYQALTKAPKEILYL
ncbi:MAG: M24 family metallopeptidase [Bacillota bacterium]